MAAILRITDLDLNAFEPIRQESLNQGFDFVDRLCREWTSGANRFDARGEALFIATASRNIVGVCGLNRDPYLYDPAVGRVRHLYVLAACRRQGLGRALLDTVVSHARANFRLLRLRTRAATDFYCAYGFQRALDPRTTHVLDLSHRTLPTSLLPNPPLNRREFPFSPVIIPGMKDLVEAINRDAALKALDLARFNHPLALNTDWTPLVGGGASFKTRNLHHISPHRIEFRHSPGYLFFWGFFIVAAAVILVLQLPGMPMHLRSESATLRTLALLGPVLFIVCGSLALILQGKAVFDRSEGFFWNGRRKGRQMPACHCPLESIAALQILRERISRTDGHPHHTSYELNLVLDNGQRLNVLDHGSLADVRLATAEVQKFLTTNPPVWDTTLTDVRPS